MECCGVDREVAVKSFVKRAVIGLIAVLGLVWLSGSVAHAASISITTLVPDISADGECSLIEAIENADADAAVHADCATGGGADIIELAAGATYTLTAVHLATDDGNGLPIITSELTIDGRGATIVRSDADGTPDFRILHVAATGALTLNDLTLLKGSVNTDGTGLGGGAVFNAGAVVLNNVTISGNKSGTDGGGISNLGGTLTIADSVVSHNIVVNSGGGIRNRNGDATLTNTVVSDNLSTTTADAGAGGGIASIAVNGNATLVLNKSVVARNTVNGLGGGGIDNAADSRSTARVSLNSSTVSDNVANGIDHTSGLGGGIQNSFLRTAFNATAILTLNDSTVSGNTGVDGGGISSAIDFTANLTLILVLNRSTVSGNEAIGNGFQVGNGGGIYIVNGASLLANSTVSGNTATGAGELSGLGGGIMNAGLTDISRMTLINTTVSDNSAASGGGGLANTQFEGDTEARFANSIVAENSAPAGANCLNFAGTLVSLGHNLENADTCNFDQPTDVISVNPLIAPLADNGGGTQTHALLPGSLAIDSADGSTCAAPPINGIDQRGVVRPQGAECDIGAYESNWATTTLALNYVFGLSDGSSGIGRFALLADGTYVDANGDTGVWSFQPTPPILFLRYDAGLACDAFFIGGFVSAGQVRGLQLCQDDSGVTGLWIGAVTASIENGLPALPLDALDAHTSAVKFSFP